MRVGHNLGIAICLFGIAASTAFALYNLGEGWPFYVNLIGMILNNEALAYNLRIRRRTSRHTANQ